MNFRYASNQDAEIKMVFKLITISSDKCSQLGNLFRIKDACSRKVSPSWRDFQHLHDFYSADVFHNRGPTWSTFLLYPNLGWSCAGKHPDSLLKSWAKLARISKSLRERLLHLFSVKVWPCWPDFSIQATAKRWTCWTPFPVGRVSLPYHVCNPLFWK